MDRIYPQNSCFDKKQTVFLLDHYFSVKNGVNMKTEDPDEYFPENFNNKSIFLIPEFFQKQFFGDNL